MEKNDSNDNLNSKLIEDGYAVVRSVVSENIVSELRQICDKFEPDDIHFNLSPLDFLQTPCLCDVAWLGEVM